jgi:hypothetical protein
MLRLLILSYCIVLLAACAEQEVLQLPEAPRILLDGKTLDTAYLFTNYKDPGASYFEDRDGTKNCNEYGVVTDITGSVNTSMPGIYTLTYNAKDTSGNPMSPVTRTIVVVESATHFLNGPYNVSCTCTATAPKEKPVTSTENYTAMVNPGPGKNDFEIITLEVGGEKIIPRCALIGDKMDVGFFTASFDWSSSSGTGTLSPSKNSFTIQTTAQRFTPSIKYTCTNIYSKLVTIKQDQ